MRVITTFFVLVILNISPWTSAAFASSDVQALIADLKVEKAEMEFSLRVLEEDLLPALRDEVAAVRSILLEKRELSPDFQRLKARINKLHRRYKKVGGKSTPSAKRVLRRIYRAQARASNFIDEQIAPLEANLEAMENQRLTLRVELSLLKGRIAALEAALLDFNLS